MKIDWKHIQLFGWYDSHCKAHVIPAKGTGQMLRVLVKGIKEGEMPLLDMPVPEDGTVQLIPEDMNPYEYVKEKGGFYCVAFYVEKGFKRIDSPR